MQQRDQADGQRRRRPSQSMRWSRRVCGMCRVRATTTQGGDADRHVDQEDPAPAGDAEDGRLPGEEAADDRAEHARGAEDGQEVALVLGPLPRRDDVADDRQRQREQAAGAEALEGAERGELYIDVANVHSTEPTTKIEIAAMKTACGRRCRRACRRAASTIVEVIRYAVVTQACRSGPCRSSAIVRIAVATIVWSSAARNMPSIRPMRIVRICLVREATVVAARAAATVRRRWQLITCSLSGEADEVGAGSGPVGAAARRSAGCSRERSKPDTRRSR